jgi:hypothetical protein
MVWAKASLGQMAHRTTRDGQFCGSRHEEACGQKGGSGYSGFYGLEREGSAEKGGPEVDVRK